jgi:hypothetical protein
MADQLDCALDLMRRMPPANIEDNLAGLIDLVPHLTEQLLSAVDQPLKIAHDPASKKDYLLCDYNRDGDSYRCVPLLNGSVSLICLIQGLPGRTDTTRQLTVAPRLRPSSARWRFKPTRFLISTVNCRHFAALS